ncbi:unnamed protein product [Allacma fusca]|uniref:Uncharacterized protein n=1 Tax=Allacma fusca TaxID=39272 RepID=A0A8J2JJQ4_9HEXA|nr:unnamed protein product [Allacma fusca]
MNAEHLDILLTSQQKIQSLVLSGFIERFDPDLKAMVYNCLKKNKEYLVDFILSPCVVTEDIFKIHYAKVYNFDCKVFQDCKHLKNIVINVGISPQIFSPRSSCGKIVNIPCLPFTLVSLELYNEEFHMEELTTFAANFYKFVHLSKLVMSSSKTHPYYIHLSWVKSLVKLKHLHRADFYSGKLHDFQGICQYMLSKPKGFITMTTLSDRVSFCRAWLDSRQSPIFKASSTCSSLNKNTKLKNDSSNLNV